jgi:hypothetical protein
MKSIHNFRFRVGHLRNAEHFQLHWSISQFLLEGIRGVGGLVTTWEEYQRDFAKENEVFKRSLVIEGTRVIYMKDRMRGDDFSLLRRVVSYGRRLPEEDKNVAAERLLDLLHTYKGAEKTALAENTGQFTKLLQDLHQPENWEAAGVLGLRSLVERLEANNRAVEQLYDKRSETLKALREEGNMKTERQRVDASYRRLATVINAIYTANEYGEQNAQLREQLEGIIDGINARIEQARGVLRRRQPPTAETPQPP